MARKKDKKAKSAGKRPLSEILPKPNKVTLQILIVAVVGVAIMWQFLLSPAAANKADLEKDILSIEAVLDVEQQELDEYVKGTTYIGAELEEKVAPYEASLPSSGTPGIAATQVQNLANNAGLDTENVTFPTAFTADVPGLRSGEMNLTVRGRRQAIIQWMDDLQELQHTITVSTTGISEKYDPREPETTADRFEANVSIKVWASATESITKTNPATVTAGVTSAADSAGVPAFEENLNPEDP